MDHRIDNKYIIMAAAGCRYFVIAQLRRVARCFCSCQLDGAMLEAQHNRVGGNPMNAVITYASWLGHNRGIAQALARELANQGAAVVCAPVSTIKVEAMT